MTDTTPEKARETAGFLRAGMEFKDGDSAAEMLESLADQVDRLTTSLAEANAKTEQTIALLTLLQSVANESISRLTAERNALAKDAARYRHLVASCNIDYAPEEPWQLVIWEPSTGEDWKAKLDAAIDNAMKEQP